MLNKQDFSLKKIEKDNNYIDYWFSLSDEALTYLNSHSNDINVKIENIILSQKEDIILCFCLNNGYNYITVLTNIVQNIDCTQIKKVLYSCLKEKNNQKEKKQQTEDSQEVLTSLFESLQGELASALEGSLDDYYLIDSVEDDACLEERHYNDPLSEWEYLKWQRKPLHWGEPEPEYLFYDTRVPP